MTPRFCVSASVISYNYVRYLCTQLGFGMRRDGDDFFIYATPESGFYVNKDTEQEPLGRLYVDEGYWSEAMYEGFPYAEDSDFFRLKGSRSFEEYCDVTNFMRIICKHLDPDREYDNSPYHGSGRTKRFMQNQYASCMIEHTEGDNALKHWVLLD